jgi:toxin ParE1/3/4
MLFRSHRSKGRTAEVATADGRAPIRIRPAMRMLVEAPYSLLYRTDPDTDEGPIGAVEIIRVIDWRRDLHSLFQA